MPGPTRTSKSKYTLGQREVLIDLEVPSGAMCQVRRPGPMGLMRVGVLDNLDILGSLVQTEHVDRVAGRATTDEDRLLQAQNLLRDKSKLEAADRLMNQVLCYVVVQPEIVMPEVQEGDRWVWLEADKREPGKIYADSVDTEDKMFVFQYVVGGTADIAQFRAQFAQTVGGLEPQQDVPVPSE